MDEVQPSPILDILDASFLVVKKLLGRGGFAVVYAATYGSSENHVALKVLLPHGQNHGQVPPVEYVKMFLREAACAKEHEHK